MSEPVHEKNPPQPLATKRLSNFKVSGLFGLFDHNIPFNVHEGITILHAPNGYGKTIVLQLLAGFFGGSLKKFRDVWFEEVEITFTDGTYAKIIQRDSTELRDDKGGTYERLYSVSYHTKDTVQTYDRWDYSKSENLDVSKLYLEKISPFIRRYDESSYLDRRTNEIIDKNEAIQRSIDYLPASMRRSNAHPKWLHSIRESIHCKIIDTHRLMVPTKKEAPSQTHWSSKTDPGFIPAVKTYSDDVAAAIERTLAEYATLSSSLDRSFPNRLLSRLQEPTPTLTEASIRKKLSEFEDDRAKYANAGLLLQAEDQSIISQASFDEPTKRILTEYVNDTEKKLAVFKEIYSRLDLFVEIINDRFSFKSISLDRHKGFEFRDIKNRPLKPESLSSGEQHELVLIYDLIFRTQKNTLLLVDEPEISLHIAWQKRVLPDLRRILKLSPMDVVLATHSPQLIAGNLDLTVQLKEPSSERIN